MFSNNQAEENDLHSSDYEGYSSDQLSDTTGFFCNPTAEAKNQSNHSNSETSWIGCTLGDGVAETENNGSDTGTVWIGCCLRDFGVVNYQALVDLQAETEHIRDTMACMNSDAVTPAA